MVEIENIEDTILSFINMNFSECLELMVYCLMFAFAIFTALYFSIWLVVQVWGFFKDIIN